MRRLVLLLASKSTELGARVADYADGLPAAADATVRSGVQIADDPLVAVAEATGRVIAPLHAMIEITTTELTDPELCDLVRGAAKSLDDAVDVARSTVVVGAVHQVTTHGPGRLELALAARRLAAITAEQMQSHWLNIHAPLALSMMPKGATERFGYEQMHTHAPSNALAAEATGFPVAAIDGLLQVHMGVPEDFLSVAAEPDFAKAIYEDELNFADQSELRGAFLSMV